jgi:hypothetical protein
MIGQALGAATFGGILNAALGASGPDQHAVSALIGATRLTLPPLDLVRLTTVLAGGLHNVFVMAAVLAAATILVALWVPRRIQAES